MLLWKTRPSSHRPFQLPPALPRPRPSRPRRPLPRCSLSAPTAAGPPPRRAPPTPPAASIPDSQRTAHSPGRRDDHRADAASCHDYAAGRGRPVVSASTPPALRALLRNMSDNLDVRAHHSSLIKAFVLALADVSKHCPLALPSCSHLSINHLRCYSPRIPIEIPTRYFSSHRLDRAPA